LNSRPPAISSACASTCHALAEKAAAQGVSVIDAPVSGGAPAVAERRLLVMVGGDADVVERGRPVFESYADLTDSADITGGAVLGAANATLSLMKHPR
jgi:3-hydroxyisobutyrate dehydrogenase-like beta-hydroxyacid dehydrogenase